ncbi:MAG: RHS repeat-associated core domain-containing protein [Candidatus Acidiferrum sp.]
MTEPQTRTKYTYDNNGNTATEVNSSGTTTFAWDFENRLSSVTLPGSGGTVSFAYDPFGRRIKKASNTGTGIYAYDGDNLIEETNSSGSAVARYSDGLNIDEPLAMLHSSTTSYYEADGLGTITSLSSGAGALAQTYTFDSFGKQTASSGSLTNPFQYTARESDPETGLYYYRARYYDAGIGRFLSEDPIRFNAKQIDFYTYAANRPATFADPSGMDPGGSCPFQFDSVSRWHMDCFKLPTAKERCSCHCVYAAEGSGCQESCMKCFSSKTPLKPHELCMCMCEAAHLNDYTGKPCKSLCEGVK